MIRVILLEHSSDKKELLCNHINQYYDLLICGAYESLNEGIRFIEKEHPDIIFLGIQMIYQADYDFMTFIHEVTTYSKIILALYEEETVKFIEFLEIRNEISSKKANNKILIDCCKLPKEKDIHEKRKISCFGKVAINYRNNQLFIKWRTKKVKELFAYLICKYDKTISKEELLRILFSGEEKLKALNKLYVTMSYLRRQLEDMGLTREEFIIQNDYSLYIKEGICDYVDFDRFVSRCTFVDEHNIKVAEDIVGIYEGMFLEEEDYIWAYEIREYADKQFEELLFKMSCYYKLHDKLEKSEALLLKIIEHNSLSIIAYNELLNLYMDTKQDEYYKKEYINYETMLANEFDDIPEIKYRSYFSFIKL